MDHPIVAVSILVAAVTGLTRSEFLFSEETKLEIDQKLINFNVNSPPALANGKWRFENVIFQRSQREGNSNDAREDKWPAELVMIKIAGQEVTPDAEAKLRSRFGKAREAVYKTLAGFSIDANFIIRKKDRSGQPALYSTLTYTMGSAEVKGKLLGAMKAQVQKAYGISAANMNPVHERTAATQEEVKTAQTSWVGTLIMLFKSQ